MLLYINEHISCRNYEPDHPTIEWLKAAKGESWERELQDNKIIIILNGEFLFSFGGVEKKISEGKMILIPGGCNCVAHAEVDANMIICRLRNHLSLCESFSMEKLFKTQIKYQGQCYTLICNEPLKTYISGLQLYLNDEVRCSYFFEIKLKELFFLLRSYYTKEELQRFFLPLLSNDMYFSDFIWKNHHKVKNVKEFAELAHYSVSGFEKRFKRVFNVSAYKWMKQQKARIILHEIHHSQKPFKEIGWDYGFASPAQFNDFCKTNFGAAPGKLRESILKEPIISN